MVLLVTVIAFDLRNISLSGTVPTSFLWCFFLGFFLSFSGWLALVSKVLDSEALVLKISSWLLAKLASLYPRLPWYIYFFSLRAPLEAFDWLVSGEWAMDCGAVAFGFSIWSSRALWLIFKGRLPLRHFWSRWILSWIFALASILLAALIRLSQGKSSPMLTIYNFIEGLSVIMWPVLKLTGHL